MEKFADLLENIMWIYVVVSVITLATLITINY